MRAGDSRTGVGGSKGVNPTAVHACGYGKQDPYERRKGKLCWESALLTRDLQILQSKEVGVYGHSTIFCEMIEHATRARRTNLGRRRQSWAG